MVMQPPTGAEAPETPFTPPEGVIFGGPDKREADQRVKQARDTGATSYSAEAKAALGDVKPNPNKSPELLRKEAAERKRVERAKKYAGTTH